MGDNKFLDGTGLQYLWSKIKANFLGKTAKAESAKTADSATKATQDGNGANIASTYAKKSEAYFQDVNAIKFNSLKTQAYTPHTASVGMIPFSYDTWHDHLAFLHTHRIDMNEVTTDGETWINANDNISNVFNKKESQSIEIMSTGVVGRRITIWSNAYHACLIYWFELCVNYTYPFSKFNVIVECSADKETWSILNNSNVTASQASWYLPCRDFVANQNYLRFTFLKTTELNTGSVRMNGIKALTYRKGDQGRGREYEFPYNWDIDRNIFPWVNETASLGKSNLKWLNIYAKQFTGDLSGTASKATADASGNNISTTYAKKSELPSAVTETTVTNWGFTKNTGTYSKPSGGIPKTDLASAVQTSLGKADTALQSYTETDPIFVASAAHGITSADITNWNGKTSNTGTITGIKMNGASKGTSGVVDLGTVITSHQSLDAYATKAAYNRKVLTDVSINAPESNFSTYLAATSAGLTALNNFANTVKTNKQSDKKYFNGTSIIDDRANSSITVELEYDSDNDKFLYLKVELDSNSEQHYFGYIPLEVATNKEVTILSSDTYAKATIKYTLTSAGVLTFSKYEMYSTPVYHPTLTFNYSNTDGTSVGTKDIELDNIQVNTVHADSADMAFKDGSGNSIENTYLNKYGDTMRGILSFSLGEGNKARIRQLYNNNILELQGGNQQGFGGFLQLFGKNYTNTNLAGSFRLSASNGGDVTPVLGSTQSYLDGKPNGTLSWNDKVIVPVEESGTNYIRYTNGMQICWGVLSGIKSNVSNQTYGKAFNNTPAFTFTSSRNPNTYPLYASWTTSTFSLSGTWNSNGHTIGWIAIGTWK